MQTQTLPEHTRTPPAAFDLAGYFDAIWSGTAQGFSEAKLREQLDDARDTLADLNAKRITPRRVVGAGVAKPLTTAREYLARRIAECERDLAAHGRTNSVNIANARYNAPQGHPSKAHRVGYASAPRDATNPASYLWQARCECGAKECGYSRVSSFTAAEVVRHMMGEHR